MTTRDEHLARCKARALEYLDAGNLADALTSMLSDLNKHPETEVRVNSTSLRRAMSAVLTKDAAGVRQWIEGHHEAR